MAEEKKSDAIVQEAAVDIEHLKKRLDMLDQRLDNIDSVVSAVVERVVKRPVAISMTCPYCGKNIEFALMGDERPKK